MARERPISASPLAVRALAEGLVAQGFTRALAPDREPLTLRWLGELVRWNQRMDLTAARTDDELVDLMLADAWVLANRIPEGARVVDVGTGAGAPGLALALLRADLLVTMVEPLQKRASFLRTMVGTFGERTLELQPVRGESLASAGWDVAISRATLPPAAWLGLGSRLAPSTWVLLAKEDPPVLEGTTLEEDVFYTWPRTSAPRRACAYVRGAG